MYKTVGKPFSLRSQHLYKFRKIDNFVHSLSIIICLTMDPLGEAPEKIGSPQAIEPTRSTEGGQASGSTRDGSAQPEQKPSVPQQQSAARTGGGVGGSNASKTSAAKRGGQAAARGGKSGGSNLDAPIYPIESLSPYQNK